MRRMPGLDRPAQWRVSSSEGDDCHPRSTCVLCSYGRLDFLADVGLPQNLPLLEIDDDSRATSTYTERGIKFINQPRGEQYGKVAVFEDVYGNRWDIIEPVVS